MNTSKLPTLTLGLVLLGIAGGAANAMPAGAMPVTPSAQTGAENLVPAQYYDDGYYVYRRRPRITVRPYFDDYSYFYPAARGFEDRNPVPRGNIRGCSVDLGYGRYESCDK